MNEELATALRHLWGGGRIPERDVGSLARQGVLLLVADRLPASARKAVHARLAEVELMRRDLVESVAALREAGVPFVPIKGMTLSQRVYGDYSLRGATDLDLVVPAAHHADALRALAAAGHRYCDDEYTRGTVEVFLCRSHQTVLEVHFAVSTADRFGRFLDEMWREPETVEIAGEALRVASREVDLVYLLVHLARHASTGKALWFEDVRRYLARFGGELRWPVVIELVERYRLANATSIAIRLCEDAFAAHGVRERFPPELVREIEALRTTHGKLLYRFLLPRLVRGGISPTTSRLHSFGLSESWRDRATLAREFVLRRVRALARRA
jgi:hypothetical protein